MLTGKESGRRCIIGGSSPHVLNIPQSFLKTGFVIGLNTWPLHHNCDYWLGVDAKRLFHAKPNPYVNVKLQRATRVISKSGDMQGIADWFADYWFEEISEGFPVKWEGKLRFHDSSATSAIHLAVILGAAEIVLCGVDYMGVNRHDGIYSWHWEECVENMNGFLDEAEQYCQIFKTNPDSKLRIPLIDIGEQ